MKVSFLLPYVGLAGGVKSTVEIAKRLQSRGHGVRIYYPKYKNVFRRKPNLKVNLKNIIEPLLGRNQVFDYGADVDIVKVPLFRDRYIEDGDAVIGAWWEDIYPLMSLSPAKGRKCHFIRHYEIWGGSEKKVHGAYEFVNTKIAISTWLKEIMETKFHQSTHLCPNGIDTAQFFFSGREDPWGRVRIGVLHNPSWPWKGADDAIGVLEHVWKRYGDRIEIVIFGDSVSEALPFPYEGILRPFGEAIRSVYSDLDIFLFTSRSEGFGNPPLEAMACRTAVVSTRVGGVPDYSVHEENILQAEPGDVAALSRQASRLIENRELRETLARNAERSARNFTWERTVDLLEKILGSPATTGELRP